MDLKVLCARGIRYGGTHYDKGDIIEDAGQREANLLIAIGKCEPYKKAKRRSRKDYETRDMKAD